MTESRELTTDTIDRLLTVLVDDAELIRYRPASSGFLPVHHVEAEIDGDRRSVVLKASRGDGTDGIDVEARLLPLLAEHTTVPVPTVLGVVDDHERLPSPAFLMTAVPGRTVPRPALGGVDEAILRRVARELGEHLATAMFRCLNSEV